MQYDPNLVLLSVLIAIVAAHATLEWLPLLGTVKHPRVAESLISLLFGLGIWSMHFTGMLATAKVIPLNYNGWLTLASLLSASVTSYVSVRFMQKRSEPRQILLQALPIATGICGMHYIGMAALEVTPALSYDLNLVLISILVAISGSCIALTIGQGHLTGLPIPPAWRLPLEALVMGLAVSGMHYTGMAAIRFPGELQLFPADGWTLETSSIVIGIGIGVLVITTTSFASALLSPEVSPFRIVLDIAVAEMALLSILPLFPSLSSPWRTLLATLVMTGLVSPLAARLSRDTRFRTAAHHTARNHAEGQRILNRLLTIRLSEKTLKSVLLESLDIILELPWLPLRDQAGIFLYHPDKKHLELVVHRRMHPALLTLCHQIALGQCLCGRAGATRSIQYAGCVDGRHTIRFEGMPPHGHYNVPLTNNGILMGVLVLYLEPGHPARDEEIRFLESLGSTLALIIDLWKKSDTIHRLAFYDPLTGLANRSLLTDRFKTAKARAKRDNTRFALLFLDLDGFKAINDSLGHGAGDELLKILAERLREQTRSTDTLARLGGDEFVILLNELNPGDARREAESVATKLLAELSLPVVLKGREYVIHASFGIALWPDHGEELEMLLQAGDAAMYEAKRKGRGGFQVYGRDLHTQANFNLALERSMPPTLESNQFYLLYQPQYEIDSGRLYGAEVLLRWHHHKLGEISRNHFIPLAESNGFIHTLGLWVLRQACRQKQAWKTKGLCRHNLHLSVNISVTQLLQDGGDASFARALEAILTETGVHPSELKLELTESAFGQSQHPDLRANIEYLDRMGIRMAMDDFGTGHASLGSLKLFPVDTIKIDRTFIKDVAKNADDEAIVRAVVALSKTLNLKVVAEGVETKQQLELLREIGCGLVQGFFSGHPMPSPELEKLLAERHCLNNSTST